MKSLEGDHNSSKVRESARRAKRIILCAMVVFILLPFLLIWMTGAFSF